MEIGNIGRLKRRAPAVAGIFYPEGREEALTALAALNAPAAGVAAADSAQGPAAKPPLALVLPHASWDLSGRVAAEGLRAAAGRPISCVVVVGPLHHPRSDALILSESDTFQTPVGDLAVERRLCAELESCGTVFVQNDIPHLEEHSIEVLLPLVKLAFPAASLVPIIVSGSKPSTVRALSRALDLIFGPEEESTLILVSTNLCDKLDAPRARAHEAAFLELLLAKDGPGLLQAIAEGRVSACGAAACAALLSTQMLSGLDASVLCRSGSTGSKDSDPSKYVGYAAVSFA